MPPGICGFCLKCLPALHCAHTGTFLQISEPSKIAGLNAGSTMSTFVIWYKSKTEFKQYHEDASVTGGVRGPGVQLAIEVSDSWPGSLRCFFLRFRFPSTSLDLQIKTVEDSPPPPSSLGEAGR